MGLIGSALITISGWVAAILFGMMLFLVIAVTKEVSMPMLKAKMGGAALLLVQRVDETYTLVAGKNKGKYVDTKKFGKFKASDNSFKPFGGTTLAQAHESTPFIVPSEFIKACKILIKKGHDDLGAIDLDELQARYEKTERNMSLEDFEAMLSDKSINPKTKEKMEKMVKERRTLDSIYSSISVIQNFLLTGGSPIEMDSIIEQEAGMKAKQKSSDSLARILTIGMATGIVIASIAAFVYVFSAYNTCPTITQFTELAQQCAGVVKTNIPM